MKAPRLAADWIGLVVRSKCVLQNGLMEAPTGTRFLVTRKHGLLNLKSEPCASCGKQMIVTRVHTRDVVIQGRALDMDDWD